MMEPYLNDLRLAFEQHADFSIATSSKAYMRNKSEFYGLPSPLRKQLVRDFVSKNGLPTIEQLEELLHYAWDQPQREWQYTALEITGKHAKNLTPEFISLAEWIITHKSWWDTVDFIAPNIVGEIFSIYPESKLQYIENWMQSGNIWLQRTCLIHQLRNNATADKDLLFNLCERLSAHPDFFIRKAIGWSLRQYSKAYPEAVIEFVNSHELSNLSKKEALKVVHKK